MRPLFLVFFLFSTFAAMAQPTAYAFLDFSGKVVTTQKAEIKWQVSQEISLDHFNLERSNNGFDFQTISSPAAKGRNSGVNYYSYTDQSLRNGSEKIYYRLQCIDKNGSVTYSSILQLQLRTHRLSLNLLSSAAIRGELNLNINGEKEETADLFITNQQGVVVKKQAVPLFNGSFIQPVDVSGISKGIYIVSIRTTNGIISERFIKK